MKRLDLTGQQFGRLVVQKYAGTNPRNGNSQWSCICTCGKQATVDAQQLRRGLTTSCGCVRRERSRARILEDSVMLEQMNARGLTEIMRAKTSINLRTNNRSGVPGVSWSKQAHRWVARMSVHGELVLNKTFATFADAVAARTAMERALIKDDLLAQRRPSRKNGRRLSKEE